MQVGARPMKHLRSHGFLPLLLALLAALAAFAAAGESPDDKPETQKDTHREQLLPSLKGPDLFRAYCAPCHGQDAKGDGPAAAALNSKVPDLTTIAQRNGGAFPEAKVRNIIAGDETMVAHGSREMPIWGPIFHQIEADRDYGNIRMKNLIDYLKSIQQK
jgi:mono/diheme cytochrome c family protein